MKTVRFEMEENLNESYEAPKCEAIGLQLEGVLCSSGDISSSYDDFIEDDYSNAGLW